MTAIMSLTAHVREEEEDINKNKRYTNDIKICRPYQQFRTVREIYRHRQYVPIFTIVSSHVGTRRFHVAEGYSDHRRSLS